MKRLVMVWVMILCMVLAVLCSSGLASDSPQGDKALPLQGFVEQVLAPMAKANDYEWRIVQEFTNEELGALIEACEANGIVLPEDGYLMRRYRDGESYGERSAISEVCETVYGGDYFEWRLSDRQWLQGVMKGIGYDDWGYEEFPGPDDLTEDEARALLFAALHENFGADIPFEDPERFRIHVSYQPDQEWDEDGTRFEDGWSWTLSCMSREGGSHYTAHMDHEGKNASAYETNSGSPRFTATPPEAYALTREEAIHLAAEAIRSETGTDAPLEDPDVYSAGAAQRTATKDGLLYWEVTFPSHSKDWGYCRATVEDVSRVVRVKEADVGPITADNIMTRWQKEYGWLSEWTPERWAEMSRAAADLPAETYEGNLLKETVYIEPRKDLLTRLQAEEIAFRAAGLTLADIDSVVLIDADPHPVWKFCLWKSYGVHVPDTFTLIEIDAATGEVLDQWLFEEDLAKEQMYCLNRTWARVSLQERGPLPMARATIKQTFPDSPDLVAYRIDWEAAFVPEIHGRTVDWKAQWNGGADYTVTLGEDGFPEWITRSFQREGIQIMEVYLGSADLDGVEAGCVMDLNGVIDRTKVQPIKTFDNMRDTANSILTQCQDHGYLRDAVLMSVTRYRGESIWVFEYAEDQRELEPEDLTDGGGTNVAVDGKTGEILIAWVDE